MTVQLSAVSFLNKSVIIFSAGVSLVHFEQEIMLVCEFRVEISIEKWCYCISTDWSGYFYRWYLCMQIKIDCWSLRGAFKGCAQKEGAGEEQRMRSKQGSCSSR